MTPDIINIDRSFIEAEVENGVCPLNWLAEFYRHDELRGKTVVLDVALLHYLLNKSSRDDVKIETVVNYDKNGVPFYEQKITIVWKATDEYPETKVQIGSYGKYPVAKDVNGRFWVVGDTNWSVIEELVADDILVDEAGNNFEYAENMKEDEQMIFLKGEQFQRELIKEKIRYVEDGLER